MQVQVLAEALQGRHTADGSMGLEQQSGYVNVAPHWLPAGFAAISMDDDYINERAVLSNTSYMPISCTPTPLSCRHTLGSWL